MLPIDYDERVYAGVLGKIIGVYLGRPFEGWEYSKIMAELGEITGYVNDRTDVALKNHTLVVPDDDISGTFVFPRALTEHGLDPTSRQIGQTWLNHLIDQRTVLWWGGLGNSTEHTAYLRLTNGIQAPASGSVQLNGTVVSEQVGAEIFIEGFAMTCPGDPERAADLVAEAARVSHDGEAVHAARVIGALVANAFVEADMDTLLDTAVSLIPGDSLISRVVSDVREWRAKDDDWHATRQRIDDRYGYHIYGGNCHVVPNHALVINALAYSGGDFGRAMTVINTCGWDTDSNSGNVGAITGVLGGLDAFAKGTDWRGPVADRMYLPTADGGAAITDAAREALVLAGLGRARAGEQTEPSPGRFHFRLPGSVQGFAADSPAATVRNDAGALAIRFDPGPDPIGVTTPTFIPPEATGRQIYRLEASPTLHSGQRVRASVRAAADNTAPITVRLAIRTYDDADQLTTIRGLETTIQPAADGDLRWEVPSTDGQPIAAVGLELDQRSAPGAIYVDVLTWDGAPDVKLTKPAGGTMWRRAWVDAVDRFDDHPRWAEPIRLVHNRGSGMLIQGGRDWRNYEVTGDVTPHLAARVGLAGHVQGLRRYYAIELVDRSVAQVLRRHDDDTTVLAESPFAWTYGTTYRLGLRFTEGRIEALIDGQNVVDTAVNDGLDSGAVALTVTEGRTSTTAVHIRPIGNAPTRD